MTWRQFVIAALLWAAAGIPIAMLMFWLVSNGAFVEHPPVDFIPSQGRNW